MVTVGVTPDDSSSPDTVCTDAGYPKVSVSLLGLEVASVHPPQGVTHQYFTSSDLDLPELSVQADLRHFPCGFRVLVVRADLTAGFGINTFVESGRR